MLRALEVIRRIVRFSLAAFVWLHALFIFENESAFLKTLAVWLRLTSSETLLLLLLLAFSLLAGTGIKTTLKNVAYVVGFPALVLWWLAYYFFRLLWKLGQIVQPASAVDVPSSVSGSVVAEVTSEPPVGLPSAVSAESRFRKVLSVVIRPFRRFTFLWCVLLIVATHRPIFWFALAVVCLHVLRAAFRVFRYAFVADRWFSKITWAIGVHVENLLNAALAVRVGALPTDLKSLFEQIRVMRKAIRFAQNRALLLRWAALLFGIGWLAVYLYLAALFAVVYVGLARAYGVSLPLANAFVDSLFLPLFATELPRLLVVRITEGFQGLLEFVLGVGTVLNYLNRRLSALHVTAVRLNRRFEDQATSERLVALEERVKNMQAGQRPGPSGGPKREAKGKKPKDLHR